MTRPSSNTNTDVLRLEVQIGAGNDRVCWRHPYEPGWCVKVAKPEQERPQNEIEYHYSRHLAKHGIEGQHIPRVIGWTPTDHGRGLMVELIRQADGSPAPSLRTAVDTGLISLEQAGVLVEEAFGWLIQNNVILADYDIDNMLVRCPTRQRCHIVFVDGLGARNFGFKYWLNRTLGFKARKKAREFKQHTLMFLQTHRYPLPPGSPTQPDCNTAPFQGDTDT